MQAALSELPRVLARPPWISGRISRSIEPLRVATKGHNELSPEEVTGYASKLKMGKAETDIDSTEVALAMFNSTAVLGGWRSEYDACAWAYFDAHVEATLFALIPVAVGETTPKRKIAERIVRKIAARDERAVRDAAAKYGKRVVASVEEILAVDRRFDCPNTPPDLPKSFRAGEFTRPKLTDGRELPVVAVERIGHMLAFSTLDRPYVGLDDVKKICEPRSLAELAWDMARAWEAAEATPKDRWMLESIAHLGDDIVVRRTTPALKDPDVVRVLGYVPTTAAATELCTIAWRVSQEKGPKPSIAPSSIAAAFAKVAQKRGITVEELEDALVPSVTAAAEANGRVTFDDRLDAFIQTHGGTRKRDVPANEIWRDLQEDVAAIADLRLRSLERAMVGGRSWTLEAFRRAWLDHPLMHHVAHGVVWRSGSKPFRVAEDGTFADVDDTTLEGVTTITVVHPAELTRDELTRWSGVLADYRIVQPIEQLARKVLRDVTGKSVEVVPQSATPQNEIYEKLRKAGFQVGWRASKQYASRKCARTAGFVGATIELEKQMVARFVVTAERNGKPIDLSEVHAVDLSEIAHDLI